MLTTKDFINQRTFLQKYPVWILGRQPCIMYYQRKFVVSALSPDEIGHVTLPAITPYT